MHQDTFSSIAKGFIYLQNVDLRGAPFEYLEGSYCDASFRSYQTNLGVVNNDIHSSGSTRLRGDKLEEALRRYHLKTLQVTKAYLFSLIQQVITGKVHTIPQVQELL